MSSPGSAWPSALPGDRTATMGSRGWASACCSTALPSMYGRTTARKWPRRASASGSLRHERFEQGLGPGLGPGVENVETAAPEAPVCEAHAVLFSRAGHIGGPLNTGWHIGRLIRSELAEVERAIVLLRPRRRLGERLVYRRLLFERSGPMDVFVDPVRRPRCLLMSEAAGIVIMHFDDGVVLALWNAEAFERSESAAIGGLDEQRAVGVGAAAQRNRIRPHRVRAVDSQVRPAGLVEHAEPPLGGRLPVVLGHLPPEGQKTGAVLLWVCLAGLGAGEADEWIVVEIEHHRELVGKRLLHRPIHKRTAPVF